ncbi:uncharacterized protein LOC124535706 [Vanessa cardui]|uniref:uncharacterized protein LOC124535706 n=1 Tax=Vanessa cardui TaxID=171605 RepID=UPI001F143EE0|nr:uncharacterized protein LOC124535706 [Vanessa cardui]
MGRRRAPVAQLTARRTAALHSDMDYFIPMMLLAVCAWAGADEPLDTVIQRRRNAYPIYASNFVDEYEPYAVAAFPMHAPMRIFQVISPAPYAGKLRKQVKRPQPNRDLHAYASSNVEQAYEPYAYEHIYEDSVSQPKYKGKGSPYDEEASSVVVYARPNKNGGYTYRKPPAPTPTPAPHSQREPIIIRIHKYRVIH